MIEIIIAISIVVLVVYFITTLIDARYRIIKVTDKYGFYYAVQKGYIFNEWMTIHTEATLYDAQQKLYIYTKKIDFDKPKYEIIQSDSWLDKISMLFQKDY